MLLLVLLLVVVLLVEPHQVVIRKQRVEPCPRGCVGWAGS